LGGGGRSYPAQSGPPLVFGPGADGVKKMNIEHRTSNIEYVMGKKEETKIGGPDLAM
jgi:hypothetical protein